jgi:hypothetical protein
MKSIVAVWSIVAAMAAGQSIELNNQNNSTLGLTASPGARDHQVEQVWLSTPESLKSEIQEIDNTEDNLGGESGESLFMKDEGASGRSLQ